MSDKFPYTIKAPKFSATNHYKATKWCEEKFGKRWSIVDNRDGIWCCFWGGRSIPGYYRWEFKNEKDALLFSLRWL